MNLNFFFRLNTKIYYSVVILLFLGLGTIFSEQIGLGTKENFILFKLGLPRSKFFIFIIFGFFLLVSTLMLHSLNVDKESKKLFFSSYHYSCLLFAISLVKTFFIYDKYSSFRWTNVLDLVLSYKILEPQILANDFLVNGNINSPKIIYSQFVSFFSYFKISPLKFYEILDIFSQLFSLSVVYILICKVIEFNNSNHRLSNFFAHLLFWFFLLEINMCFFQEKLTISKFTPFLGFNSIAYSTHFSIFLGILFMTFYKKKRNIVNSCLFFLTTIFNPLIGIFIILTWTILFYVKEKSHKNLILFMFILTVVGIAEKLIFQQQVLNDKEFIDIYIYKRHSHHYLLSLVPIYKIIIHLALFLIPITLSKRKIFQNISTYIFISYIGLHLAHYFFIEIIPIKIFATLTLSRYSMFSLFLLIVSYGTLLNDLFLKQGLKKSIWNTFNIGLNFQITKIKKPFYFLSCIGTVLLVLNLPSKRIEGMFNEVCPDFNLVSKWVSENSDAMDVFQTYPSDIRLNFFLRIFTKRNIYWGYEFPFNEIYFKEWEKRRVVYNSFFSCPNTQREINSQNINYIVVKNKYINKNLRGRSLKRFKNISIFKSEIFFNNY